MTILRHTADEEADDRINPDHFEVLSSFFQYLTNQFYFFFKATILNACQALNKLSEVKCSSMKCQHMEADPIKIE